MNNPTTPNKAWMDGVYCAIWGFLAYDGSGFCAALDDAYQPAALPADNNFGDTDIKGGKWYGFFRGIGMAAQYPAVRLGGLFLTMPVTETSSCKAVYSTTASCKVIATEPNGATVTATCALSATCSVSLDGRQGNHLYVMQWISAGAVVLGQTQPTPIKPI